ncbi:MAG: sigma-70 family RNA polymerase sigma factor [Acidobacteria bacterium]|nr:sigma-70 family RNA polymerase sigma factor [Acidobacteriota bacterium]
MLEMTSESQTEAQVIEACQRGDMEALRVLFDRYKDRIFSIAHYVSQDEASAQDITQEIFIKLFRQIGQYRGDARFTTWLYRLVVNTCRDEARNTRRFLPISEAAASSLPAESTLEEHYLQCEISKQVRTAVMKLKLKFRLPMLLRHLEGLSYDEIAAVLGLRSGTVASRLNRGRALLARDLRHLRDSIHPGK